MDKKMKVAVMTGIGQIEFIEKSIPVPASNEALVKINTVGICGSDLHYFEQGRIGDYIVEPPFVLGHEASGTVVKIGSEVHHLKIGDRVALEPGKTCGVCEYCKKGLYNLCADVIFFATPPVDGIFQEYVAHEASLCFKLPESVSNLDGAMIEPLAVGLHAANQGKAEAGQTAVVMGSGCIGLMSLLALQIKGVSKIFVVDIIDSRLNKAKELGASEIINGKKTDVVEKILELTDGRGCDIVIDTAGIDSTMQQAVGACRKGATIVIVGYPVSGRIDFPASLFMDKELHMESVFRYRHIYPMAIEAVANKKVNLSDVVTDIFEFDELQNALDRSIVDKENIVKAAIKISD